jgi:hypothetical protein
MRADYGAAGRLKELLDDFAAATGLTINFHKSMVVLLFIPAQDLAAITDALGCKDEGFPQVYLGLPLTAEKLKPEHFTPLIARVDKYLSG